VPAAAIVTLPDRAPRELAGWLRQRAALEGLTVTDEAARLLVELTGEDTATLMGEVRKAALAGGPDNRNVGVRDVGAIVGEHRLSELFDLPRAVEKRDVAAALRTLDRLLATEDALLLLAVLVRNVRTAWTAVAARRRGRSVDEIARALRLPPGVIATLTSAERPDTHFARQIRRCWETEHRLKSSGEPRRRWRRWWPICARSGDRPLDPRRPSPRAHVDRRLRRRGRALRRVRDRRRRVRAFRVPPERRWPATAACSDGCSFPISSGRYRYAFWFRPSAGQHDPVGARALVLENPKARVAWVTVDLIAVDRAFTTALQERLTATSFPPATLIVSASHTHSGPGAFMDSELSGLIAVDRMDSTVRSALIEGVAAAIRRADGARAPALFAATRVTAPAVTSSRIREPLDPEIVVLKITRTDGKPLASSGTSRSTARCSGGKPAAIGRRDGCCLRNARAAARRAGPLRQRSRGRREPAGHGLTALSETAGALAAAVETGWAEARAVPAVRLHVARQTVALPRPAVSLKRCAGGWVPGFFALPLFGLAAETELIGAAVGDTAWVTIPGELQTSFGLAIKRELRGLFGAVFLAGLSNDYLGYFMGPEAAASKSYVACATLYGPDTASCLADGALDVFYRLAERTRRRAARRLGAPRVGKRGEAAGARRGKNGGYAVARRRASADFLRAAVLR
jgi:hypothetical protein